jgi:hypothetical protein
MGRRDGRARPGIAAEPPGVKTPGLAAEPVKDKPLSWRLSRVDFLGDWGWSNLAADEMATLHGELADCEGETLYNLLKAEAIKDIPTEHMVRKAKERLVDLGFEEHDTLWELRLNGKRRVWGFVHDADFYILWWDPDETACGRVSRQRNRRRSHP